MTVILSSRNLSTQSGARNLILKRAIAQNLFFDDEQKLISFVPVSDKDPLQIFENQGIKSKKIPVNKSSILSIISGFFKLVHISRQFKNERLVITGYFPEFIVCMLILIHKQNNIYYDVHGAVEEKIEYPKTKLIYEWPKYIFLKINSIFIYNVVSNHLVVSKSLKNYVQNYRYRKKPPKFVLVPCTDYSINNTLVNSKTINTPFNFIYTGSNAPWQCLKETLDIYRSICEIYPSNLTLLVSDENYEVPLEYSNLSISKYTVSSEEVSSFLSAADFAFLIRKNDITNKVAFPNKFYDYISHNLPVITTNAIDDISRAITEYKLGSIIEIDKYSPNEIINDCKISIDSNNFKNYSELNLFQNTLKNFYND